MKVGSDLFAEGTPKEIIIKPWYGQYQKNVGMAVIDILSFIYIGGQTNTVLLCIINLRLCPMHLGVINGAGKATKKDSETKK